MTRTLLKKISDVIGVFIDPRFWIRNYPPNHAWSDVLDQAIADGKPLSEYDAYTVNMGRCRIWISDWPYAYGSPRSDNEMIPRRATALRLREYVSVHAAAHHARFIDAVGK